LAFVERLGETPPLTPDRSTWRARYDQIVVHFDDVGHACNVTRDASGQAARSFSIHVLRKMRSALTAYYESEVGAAREQALEAALKFEDDEPGPLALTRRIIGAIDPIPADSRRAEAIAVADKFFADRIAEREEPPKPK
jgi:hypothetical protein